MSTDEKLAILARAILELAQKAATEWDYGGEQTVLTGVMLALEDELRKIAEAG